MLENRNDIQSVLPDSIVSSKLFLPSNVIGDANGDGEITVADATEIQKAGIELIKLDGSAAMAADVDGDGRISILDATCVQKYIAGYAEETGNAGKDLPAA